MSSIVSTLTLLVGCYLAVVGLAFLFQDRMVYFPTATIDATPRAIGLDYEDVTFSADDGTRLHGWFVPAGSSARTLLFFHGNAGNISHRLGSIRIFNDIGLNVFIIDYRGYGMSEGSPGEQGTYRDADAAWRYLTEERGIHSQSIVAFGRSLGGGIASYTAAEFDPGGLIMESSFTSLVELGRRHYPWLPVALLSRNRYDSLERMKDIACPLLVVHSPDDEIVPIKLGRRLFDAAAEPKSFLEITGSHNTGVDVSGERYVLGLRKFLGTLDALPGGTD